jgi:hypothetical protein
LPKQKKFCEARRPYAGTGFSYCIPPNVEKRLFQCQSSKNALIIGIPKIWAWVKVLDIVI